MEARQEYPHNYSNLDYSLFEADLDEEAELIFNDEYIHLRELDQEMCLGIFKNRIL